MRRVLATLRFLLADSDTTTLSARLPQAVALLKNNLERQRELFI